MTGTTGKAEIFFIGSPLQQPWSISPLRFPGKRVTRHQEGMGQVSGRSRPSRAQARRPIRYQERRVNVQLSGRAGSSRGMKDRQDAPVKQVPAPGTQRRLGWAKHSTLPKGKQRKLAPIKGQIDIRRWISSKGLTERGDHQTRPAGRDKDRRLETSQGSQREGEGT